MPTNINFIKSLGIGDETRITLPSLDPATKSYLVATGITGTTQIAAINNLVTGLKADGLWSKMKAVYPFVTDNINRLSYTNTLTNAYWQRSQIVLTSGQSDANGGTNATQCAGSAATNAYIYGTTTQTIIGQTYTASVYLRGDSSGSVSFRVDSGGSTPSNPVNYTTSWQRFTYTFVAGFTSADWVIGGYNTWTGSETIYIYAPQLELGSTATTYQPIATTQQAYISSQFKYNLVNPVDSDAAFRLVFNGGWTHSSTGATPNGTNGYADTFLAPSSVLSLNNTHLSIYSRTNNSNDIVDIGSEQLLGNRMVLHIKWSDTNGYYDMYNQSTNRITYTMGSNASTGLFVNNRTSNVLHNIWRNGTKLATSTNVSIGSLPPAKIFLSALGSTGPTLYYSNRNLAFSTIGDGLLDAEASNLYSRVQQFQVSLSRNV